MEKLESVHNAASTARNIDVLSEYMNQEVREDGRHYLAPSVSTINGSDAFISSHDESQLALLHNEFHNVDLYPTSLEQGTYFSEALGPLNTRREEYRKMINEGLRSVTAQYVDGAFPFEKIHELGSAIQSIDSAFAAPRVQADLDEIHKCCGPNPEHPYAKITLFRTTMNVRMGEKVRKLFLEKFLVSYSYLDKGQLKPTITPIHAHPSNVEVGYFGHFDQEIDGEEEPKAVEQQFIGMYKGEPILKGTALNQEATSDPAILQKYRLELGEKFEILPSKEPFLFPASQIDEAVLSNPRAFLNLSGLLRPHQVTIQGKNTSFFSIITYFTPTGEVIVFNDDGTPKTETWSHSDWSGDET